MEFDSIIIYSYGDVQVAEEIGKAAALYGKNGAYHALVTARGHFACIVEHENFVFAAVDNCRSIPVYYADEFVSNSAELVRTEAGLNELDSNAVIEFAMAGFVVGGGTVYKGLKQLQAGQFLFWRMNEARPTIDFYYRFWPDSLLNESVDDLASLTGTAFNNVMRRVIEKIGDRPVWVPLSGGLDSRLILCKLVELKCPNVNAFSYGAAGSDEARSARMVAGFLGVPWHFMPSRKNDMRCLFASERRKDLWRFSSGFNSVPNLQDFLPLCQLMTRNFVREGDVIINGQSGDFISGGHIPPHLLENGVTLDDMFDALVKKHFSLWDSLKTPHNIALVKSRVFANMGLRGDENMSPQEIAAVYELSEYQERQSKFVVNGQRVYDFLGLDWFLPLWDQEFVDVWRNIPAQAKIGQMIYKRYLETYDYKGLFSNFTPCLDGWPGLSKAVLPLARVIRLTLGTGWRDRYLKAMAVFGMYGYLYATHPLLKTIRESQNLRNPISLFARTWLLENDVPLPHELQ